MERGEGFGGFLSKERKMFWEKFSRQNGVSTQQNTAPKKTKNLGRFSWGKNCVPDANVTHGVKLELMPKNKEKVDEKSRTGGA